MAKWLPRKRNIWMRIIVAALIVVLGACSDNRDTQDRKDASSKQSHNIVKQGDRILFTLGDREFNIPEGNFKGGGETGSGQLVQVSLWGLLPDFEGYDKAKNHEEFVGPSRGRGWGRYAEIVLYRREDRITVPEMVYAFAWKTNTGALSGREGDYDELRYGLEYYRSTNWGDDIYLYREDGRPVIYINCPSEIALRKRSSPSCTYYWDISKGTSYEMWYSMDYLPRWREIWLNAQRLVNGKK